MEHSDNCLALIEHAAQKKHKFKMKKVYNSKIGLELVIPLVLVFGMVLILTIGDKQNLIGIITLLSTIAFVVHMFLTTNYSIEGTKLTIKCGFVFNKTIDINSIKKISETNNLISSPATSLDRLEITYGKFDSVIISPKQKKEFINDLKIVNPNIEVKFKKENKM